MQVFQDFLNKKLEENEDLEVEVLKEEEKENIERLLEELIWVFDFENEDKCSISQKELLQQIL